MSFAAMIAVALAIDAALGWPAWLYARIGHPVTWIGALIDALDKRWNDGDKMRRRAMGVLCVLVVTGAVIVPAVVVQILMPSGAWGLFLGALLAWPLIAARSLYEHVAAVAHTLSAGNLTAARSAVAMIVGRDPAQLDQGGVARASLESLAENASDGIVAPLFWGAIAGLPGIAAYKAINTMDSMIGHRTHRYEDFGKVAALLDDLVNLIPARLTGLAIALSSGQARAAFQVMILDARHHRSPNAGWPEAAMAGALGVRLSGPRVYANRTAQEPWLNASAPDPTANTLKQGLALYVRAMMMCGVVLVAVSLL